MNNLDTAFYWYVAALVVATIFAICTYQIVVP
jgi:hypothetical protein